MRHRHRGTPHRECDEVCSEMKKKKSLFSMNMFLFDNDLKVLVCRHLNLPIGEQCPFSREREICCGRP